jgi:hypothetical protein
MSDWQERITRETAPTIRAEHELRYRIAAPLIARSAVWGDLGCGNGLAAAAALGGSRAAERGSRAAAGGSRAAAGGSRAAAGGSPTAAGGALPAHAVLVDMDEEVVARAAGELGVERAVGIAGDLTDPGDLARIGEALLAVAGERVVTCFEVVEHLRSFLPFVEWAGALAREGAATFVISVPNDAFWAIENPHHLTAWSEGAFAELRGLLPAEHTLLRQVALTGSALVDWDAGGGDAAGGDAAGGDAAGGDAAGGDAGGGDAGRAHYGLSVDAGGPGSVATHFIAAFGPRHGELWRGALAVQADQLEQRRWERQRESDVAVAQQVAEAQRAAVAAQDVTIARQRAELDAQTAQFDAWRAYIHELERELGRPLSGQQEQEPPA